ncbi:MAG TPA: protein kinase [Gemmataceae bacterium]|nr:protein kinase [Gemmataceae bacterium]
MSHSSLSAVPRPAPHPSGTVEAALPPALALRVNEVCDQFEAAWKGAAAGTPGPRIEDHLAGVPAAALPSLLRHLVLLDVDYRRLRDERPSSPEYAARFPALPARFLIQVFGATLPDSDPPGDGRKLPGADPNGAPPEPTTTVIAPPFQPQLRSRRYVLRRFHARGGIGEVWLAEDAEIGRQVALKRLRPKRDGQEERFLVEAQVTGQLEHPGIVPVHDLGVDEDGRPFYVMSFIHGRTLREAIDEHHATGPAAESGEVEFSRLLEVFVKMCHAVAYAHHRGVVHRDLKPDNVMLGPFGEALVLDWGMAKILSQPEAGTGAPPVQPTYSSGSSETQDGMVMGSPAYMAPEAAAGRAAEADARTDVYLLGGTLYHVLTGRPPREGRSHEEVVELAKTMPPPSPRRLKPDVPRALEAICLKALAHRMADRYAGAGELARDMERYLAGAPVSAYREPAHVRAFRWCKRHRRGIVRALGVAVVLALAGAGATLLRDAWARERAIRAEAEDQRRAAETLRRAEQARRDLALFHSLADERRLHADGTTPVGMVTISYDARRGQGVGQRALELAERLAPELDDLSLADERAAFGAEFHALLLLTTQAECQPLPDPNEAPALLRRLERAAPLGGPSRSYHRLPARCRRALCDQEAAADDERRAEATPPTVLDHFLQGEDYRLRSAAPDQTSEDALLWRPDPGLLRQAVAEYQAALRAEPDNFWCYAMLGRCYRALGQGPEAVEALGTCVALRPNRPWGYSARGLALGQLGRYPEAEADLNRALEIDPDFAPARLHRGVLAWLRGKHEQALADFNAVLKLPEDRRLLEAYYYLGWLHLSRREYPEALSQFDALVKENATFRPVYLLRAQVYFSHGDELHGLGDLTTFLNLARPAPHDAKDPLPFALRGRLLGQLVPKWGLAGPDRIARMRLARDQLETARRLGYRSAALFDDLGSVAQRLGEWDESRRREEWDEACADYEEALRTAPPDLAVKVYTKRAWIYAQSDPPQLGKARDDFAGAMRLDPAHADAHAGLGYVRALDGAPAEARDEAALALWHGGDDYLILHNVACVYAVLSETEKGQTRQDQDMAVGLLRRAVQLCHHAGDGDKELRQIQGDSSLAVLSGHPGFRQLLGGAGR